MFLPNFELVYIWESYHKNKKGELLELHQRYQQRKAH